MTMSPEMEALKARLKAMWMAGDYGYFAGTYYGPTNRAFAALDADKQAALRSDLEQLWSAHNKASDGGTEIEAEYLEVTAIRA